MIIFSLITIIVILLVIILFTLVVRPSWNNYVLNRQIEAQQMTIGGIIQQVQQQGGIVLLDAEGNQIVLVQGKIPEAAPTISG